MATTVKTTISINKTLFEQAESLAKQMNVSRSSLFALALEEYLKRYHSRALLNEINVAYADQPDLAEQKGLRYMRESQRSLVEGEW